MRRAVLVQGLVLVCVSGVWFLAGCGGSSVPLAPVQGKVTVNGTPLSGGHVALIPLSSDPGAKSTPAGEINNGEYTIYTGGKAGAPLGKYKVMVTPSMMPVPGQKQPMIPFDKKYSDPTATPLTIEVVQNPAPGAYDLKLTK
jgi:hypothetical protein